MMKIIVLDKNTISYNDVDFSPIEALGDVTYFDKMPDDALPLACKGADAVLVNKASIGEELIAALPSVKYVGSFSTGYNNVDLDAFKRHGVTFCNAPHYSTNAVAQHTISLLLMCAGNTHRYAKSVADGKWITSDTFCYYSFPQTEVFDKTLGIFGYGDIGKAVAKIGDALGMNVIVYSRRKPNDCPYPFVTKEEIFSRSDFLSFHCPLNEGTKEIVNEHTLSLMKRSAVIVNTSRGGLVNEADLAKALKDKRLAAACLDVVASEPMRADNPLYGVENCMITPHVAWQPAETRQRLVAIVADNLKSFMQGQPKNVITE